MTEHGRHHYMIHRHVGAQPIEMWNAAQERKAVLIEPTLSERLSGEFYTLHHVRGFMTKPLRRHAKRAAATHCQQVVAEMPNMIAEYPSIHVVTHFHDNEPSDPRGIS